MRLAVENQRKALAASVNEMDFIDYIDDLERQWRENLRETIPSTEAGWLEIFPDARPIVEEKIKEWQDVARVARLQIKETLRVIAEKSEKKDRWYWNGILKYTFQPVRDLALANSRIASLKWLLPQKNDNRRAAWQFALEQARRQEIVHVAESYGLRLRKTGNTYQALCPLHSERTPSFHIYPPSRFVCFGCDEKGDVITFVQAMSNCTFKEAVYMLQKAI